MDSKEDLQQKTLFIN